MLDTRVSEFRKSLRTFCDASIFRSATADELVVRGNPFRRPVRPEDVGFIDLSSPVSKHDASSLTSLISARSLLNALEIDSAYPVSTAAEADAAEFYAPETRRRARLVEDSLRQHLFSDVERQAAERVHELGAEAAIADARERCTRSIETAVTTAFRFGDPKIARETLAAQIALVYFGAVIESGSVNGAGTPHAAALGRMTSFVAETNLGVEPHSHFQFYLPSSLRLRAYERLTAREPAESAHGRGARSCEQLEAQVLAGVLRAAGAEPGSPSVASTAGTGDEPGDVTAFARGVVERQILRSFADADFLTQIAWVSQFETYRRLAREIYSTIQRDGIHVDLETYVESSAECSTTHVHDTDRLLVIETGEMDFWNAIGTEHRFRVGDCFLIPRHRLHGSVVRSGTCTYHQPIIPESLMRYSDDPCTAVAAELAKSV